MRLVALISMVKWCKEDRHSFERIQAEMRETERTPDARKLLMQVRPRAINPNPNPLTLSLTLTLTPTLTPTLTLNPIGRPAVPSLRRVYPDCWARPRLLLGLSIPGGRHTPPSGCRGSMALSYACYVTSRRKYPLRVGTVGVR